MCTHARTITVPVTGTYVDLVVLKLGFGLVGFS